MFKATLRRAADCSSISRHMSDLKVRRAVPEDAAGIVAVLSVVVGERVHSAIDAVWSVEQERRYLASLSARETIHVAVDVSDRIVGLQILDRCS